MPRAGVGWQGVFLTAAAVPGASWFAPLSGTSPEAICVRLLLERLGDAEQISAVDPYWGARFWAAVIPQDPAGPGIGPLPSHRTTQPRQPHPAHGTDETGPPYGHTVGRSHRSPNVGGCV